MRHHLFEWKEGLLISLAAIRANKARSLLTMLGIVIGICSVALMATAINGIDKAFVNGISSLGADNLYIDKYAWFSNEDFFLMRNRKNVSLDQFERFQKLAKLPLAMAPTILTVHKVLFGNNYVEGTLMTGTTDGYVRTTNFNFARGRFFTGLESSGARNVAVLGSEVAAHLFERQDPLAQEVKVDGIPFRVVGVLEKQGSNLLGNFNPDNQVYMPIGTVFKYFRRDRDTVTIVVRARSTAMIAATKEEAYGVMRRVRGLMYDEKDDFSINQQEGLTDNYNRVVGVIKIVGLFITGLSLLVGAIGIMNIMFVSVKERTREIGIRKAIGAKRRTIMGQFLTEAALICLIGGLVGLLLAIALSMVINKFLPTSVQLNTVLLAISISLITGIISGLAPAWTAAKMDPVEALRYE
ncbi:MAG: ABC transporter permease [Candidatus Aminicenantes bacterium]|nr:ABC transporter permease [Candidatus Aminicenantes bacterium]